MYSEKCLDTNLSKTHNGHFSNHQRAIGKCRCTFMTVNCKCLILCSLAPVQITSTLFTFFTKIPLPTLLFIAFPNPAFFFFRIHTLKRPFSVKRPINDMNVRCRLALSIDILSLYACFKAIAKKKAGGGGGGEEGYFRLSPNSHPFDFFFVLLTIRCAFPTT